MEIHHFPTPFARELAAGVDLFHRDVYSMDSQHKDYARADKLYGCLRDFQKLALFNKFEDALVVYHGVELNDEQKAALTIIHESSKSWALGHVAETLMNNLDTGDAKTMQAMAQTLLEQLNSKDGTITPNVKRFVVGLAKLD